MLYDLNMIYSNDENYIFGMFSIQDDDASTKVLLQKNEILNLLFYLKFYFDNLVE